MDTRRYMISDAAKMVDVEAHVLRYWEEELELPVERNEMGHRCYTEENIRIFHQIKALKEQGLQLKAIKALLPEMEQGKVPPVVVREPEPVNDKMEQFQLILGKVVSQAIRENQQEMGKELSHQVSTQVVKEMDYLFRLQEEREETHYRKLDELIRSSQEERKRLGRKPRKKEKSQRSKRPRLRNHEKNPGSSARKKILLQNKYQTGTAIPRRKLRGISLSHKEFSLFTCRNRSGRALCFAGSAVQACICVDYILSISFRDRFCRTNICAGAASYTFIRNNVCHDTHPPYTI